MCDSCGCHHHDEVELPVQYQCDCGDDECACDAIIEFEAEPDATPYCCGKPMKRIK